MIAKSILLGVVLASPPVYLTATALQGPSDGAGPGDAAVAGARDLAGDVARAQQEIAALRVELARVRATADAAEARAGKLAGELEEALDLLEHATCEQRESRGNCSPSRSRTLLTQYQWLQQRGHEARADRALATAVERIGDDRNRLNNVVWELVTDEETAGQYDTAALALARRLQQQGDLQHNQLDTVALVCFLNGHVDEAIDLQQQAIRAGGRGDDYRRRLRTYQAAKNVARVVSPAERERLAGGD